MSSAVARTSTSTIPKLPKGIKKQRPHVGRLTPMTSELRLGLPTRLEMLQMQKLVMLQAHLQKTGGRDRRSCSKAATRAGKGGAIKTYARKPQSRASTLGRACPSHRIARRTQWYFQRYVDWLPAAGEHGAVRPLLVQPGRRRAGNGVLHARADHERFLEEAPRFEKMLVR